MSFEQKHIDTTFKLWRALHDEAIKSYVMPATEWLIYAADCRFFDALYTGKPVNSDFDLEKPFFFREMRVYATVLPEVPPDGFGLVRIPDKHPAEMSWAELQALAAPGMEHTPE